MDIETFQEMLDQSGLYYIFDNVMKLWLIFIDDMTIYVDPKNLTELSNDEFKIFLTTKILKLSTGMEREIIVH